ncbi:phenylalanine--tRNA ligase beta subunit-like isoform X1 [Brevipalpus obovatus]|uniref:phenylalanine--tRNA ligase beta subunit-like isoform X1 n=1 Tax=Brevipalpus obovatus TaxID=246614 RepID=UPI003D9F0F2E
MTRMKVSSIFKINFIKIFVENVRLLQSEHMILIQFRALSSMMRNHPVMLDSSQWGENILIATCFICSTNLYVLIECTANDENKAKIVLDTIVCMFSEYCSPKFQKLKYFTNILVRLKLIQICTWAKKFLFLT